MKKLFIAISLALLLCTLVNASPIHKYADETELSNAVSLFKVREFYEDYNLSYSYMKVDLTDDNTKIELLKSPEGVDVLSSVKNLAQQDRNVIGALNADFFSNEGGGVGFSLGTEIVDGKLIQSPIYPETMATVFVGGDDVIMSYMDYSMSVLLPNEQSVKISHLNKHTAYYGDVLWYTHLWNGGMTKAVGGSVAEFVFKEDVLTEIRRNAEPYKIGEDEYVLVVDEGMNGGLSSLSVGDKIQIKVDCFFDLSLFDTAFGGGSMLVYEGKDVGKIGDYAHTVAGFHPRSAVGITEDKKTMYILAVDGRQTGSRGMRMSHVAELLIELGCYYGVNLDGGGSTNMVAKDMWQEGYFTANNPTENRKVINAVGIVHETDEKTGVPRGIAIKSDKENVFIGDNATLFVTCFDEYKQRAQFDVNDIEWSSTSGKIENNVFYPDTWGLVTISATLDELYCDMTINVLGNVSGINTDKKIHMQIGDSEKIILSVFDYMGNNALIDDLSMFSFESSDTNIVKVQNGLVTAVGVGSAYVKVSLGDVATYISVSVGGSAFEYTDSFENNGRTSSVFPDDTRGSFELSDDFSHSGAFSGMFSFDFTMPEQIEREAEDSSELVSIDSTQIEDISRSVVFSLGENIVLDEKCERVSVYAFTKNPFNHKLCALIVDDRGEEISIEFEGDLPERKWSKLEAAIPKDVSLPVSLSQIYVLYTPEEQKDSGSIFVDDLSFYSFKANSPKISPNDVYRAGGINTGVKSTFRVGTLSQKDIPTPFAYYGDGAVKAYVGAVSNSTLLGEGQGFMIGEDKNAFYVHVNTHKGGIRKTDKNQWKQLVAMAENHDKEYLFITCDTSIFGSDEFENEVIIDYFNSLNKDVFIIMADDSSSYTDYGRLKIFTLDNSPTESLCFDRSKAANVIEFEMGDTVTFKFEYR